MLILGIDTSGRHGSIALAENEDDTGRFHCLETVPLRAAAFSAQLVPEIQSLLARHTASLSTLRGLAVASGPGSFTGLRVGLSTVKALAEVTAIPIAAISILEAVAWASHDEGRVIAAMDAGRGQLFVGDYQVGGGGSLLIKESLVQLSELIAACRKDATIPLVTSDESLQQQLQAHELTARLVPPLQAEVIARIGLARILRGETISPEALDANYIRRSDAELLSLHQRS